MIIIGINGNPGSGKTTISKMLLDDKNVKVVHLDEIFNGIKDKLPKKYTLNVTRDDGDEFIFLSHGSLYNKVASNSGLSALYKKLRLIIAKVILKNVIDDSKKSNYDYLIIEGSALLDYLSEKTFDVLIDVQARYSIREKRVLKRNADVELNNCNPLLDFIDEFDSDYTILNEGSLEELSGNVKTVEEDILSRFKNKNLN